MSEDRPHSPSDEEWRNRFIIINFVRIGGTALVFLGLAIWQTDLIREGGWPVVGMVLAFLGLLVSFGGARVLVRRWRTPPDP